MGNATRRSEEQLLTVVEAARELGVSESTARRLIKNGELPSYRPTPGKIWVLKEHVDVFREMRTSSGAGGQRVS
jgi:excisionase family DNA binding protein